MSYGPYAHTALAAEPAPVPPRRASVGFARIYGTVRAPWLEIHINPGESHPTNHLLTMRDWVKSLGSARWDASARAWLVPQVNSTTPSAVLAEAGIELDWGQRPEQFSTVSSIDELAVPIAKLSQNRRTVMIRPRLCGFDIGEELIGNGGVWDKDRRIFRTDATDVLLPGGVVRPGILWSQDAIDEAYARHQHQPVDDEHAELARDLSQSLNVDAFDPAAIAALGAWPKDGREPFPFQVAGAYAVTAGRGCLFDEMGVGKTAQSLYAARLLATRRTLIVVPPLLTTNWAREIEHAKLCPPEQVAMFRAGRKEPALPDSGAVIIADSLLASRPATAARIAEWGADVMIVDEAHRLKTIGSARGDAVLDVSMSVKHPPIVLTGTPIFATPNEMVTLLELARVIGPVFGGRHQFLEDFCFKNQFRAWKPRKSALNRLRVTLEEHVWVRRRKKDVLPQLPPKRREAMLLDVPLTDYREAHKEAASKIKAWLTWFTEQNSREPHDDDVKDWINYSGFSLISQMRQAAGLAKISKAAELIRDHVSETGFDADERGTHVYRRPLIVWVHHKSVAHAMFDALPEELGQAAMIGGATSDRQRDEICDLFQEGRIPILVASITKAGVGLTLTRGADAIFVESDWTPANILQAEDRFHRQGQIADACLYTTLLARGTLDETIQRVLGEKITVLEKGLGDDGNSVALVGGDDARSLGDIVKELFVKAQREWRKEQAQKQPVAA